MIYHDISYSPIIKLARDVSMSSSRFAEGLVLLVVRHVICLRHPDDGDFDGFDEVRMPKVWSNDEKWGPWGFDWG